MEGGPEQSDIGRTEPKQKYSSLRKIPDRGQLEALAAQHLTQGQIAEALGVSRKTLKRYSKEQDISLDRTPSREELESYATMHLTQAEIAKKLHINEQTVRIYYRRRGLPVPHADELRRINIQQTMRAQAEEISQRSKDPIIAERRKIGTANARENLEQSERIARRMYSTPAWNALTDTERKFLIERFGLEGQKKSFSEIANERGVTNSSVISSVKAAIVKLGRFQEDLDKNI